MTINVKVATLGGNLPKLWKQKAGEVHLAIAADLAEEAAALIVIMQENYYSVPETPNYVRTYNLQSSWRIVPNTLGGAVSVNIRNNAIEQPSSFVSKKNGRTYTRKRIKARPYAGLVQGPLESTTGKTQWWYHGARGWLSMDSVLLDRQTSKRLAEKMKRRLHITV